MAVKGRFKYIVKDWRMHLSQVSNLQEAIVSLPLVTFPPLPTTGGCVGKFNSWIRGSLESEHLGSSLASAGSYVFERSWASQLQSSLWKVPEKDT